MKSKRELIKEIADHILVIRVGSGTWEIRSCIVFPMKDGDDFPKYLHINSHNEEDYTGIFDGEVYNPTGGFDSVDDLDRVAQEECMTVETLLQSIWSDTANEDNYESTRERNLRLAVRLWEKCVEPWDRFSDILFK